MSAKKDIVVEIDGVEYGETWEIELSYTPGEPAVMYYRDGSGYPGSSPEVEIISAELLSRSNEDGEAVEFEPMKLDEHDWIARSGMSYEEFQEWAFQEAEDAHEAAYEDACEREAEEARLEGRAPRHIRRRQ